MDAEEDRPISGNPNVFKDMMDDSANMSSPTVATEPDFSAMSVEECLAHKNWKARVHALERLTKDLTADNVVATFNTAAPIVGDLNVSVIDSALEALLSVLKREDASAVFSECQEALEKLLERVGTKTVELRKSASDKALSVAQSVLASRTDLLPMFLLSLLAGIPGKPPKTAILHMQFALQLFDTSNSPFTGQAGPPPDTDWSGVLSNLHDCLTCKTGDVRKDAETLTQNLATLGTVVPVKAIAAYLKQKAYASEPLTGVLAECLAKTAGMPKAGAKPRPPPKAASAAPPRTPVSASAKGSGSQFPLKPVYSREDPFSQPGSPRSSATVTLCMFAPETTNYLAGLYVPKQLLADASAKSWQAQKDAIDALALFFDPFEGVPPDFASTKKADCVDPEELKPKLLALVKTMHDVVENAANINVVISALRFLRNVYVSVSSSVLTLGTARLILNSLAGRLRARKAPIPALSHSALDAIVCHLLPFSDYTNVLPQMFTLPLLPTSFLAKIEAMAFSFESIDQYILETCGNLSPASLKKTIASTTKVTSCTQLYIEFCAFIARLFTNLLHFAVNLVGHSGAGASADKFGWQGADSEDTLRQLRASVAGALSPAAVDRVKSFLRDSEFAGLRPLRFSSEGSLKASSARQLSASAAEFRDEILLADLDLAGFPTGAGFTEVPLYLLVNLFNTVLGGQNDFLAVKPLVAIKYCLSIMQMDPAPDLREATVAAMHVTDTLLRVKLVMSIVPGSPSRQSRGAPSLSGHTPGNAPGRSPTHSPRREVPRRSSDGRKSVSTRQSESAEKPPVSPIYTKQRAAAGQKASTPTGPPPPPPPPPPSGGSFDGGMKDGPADLTTRNQFFQSHNMREKVLRYPAVLFSCCHFLNTIDAAPGGEDGGGGAAGGSPVSVRLADEPLFKVGLTAGDIELLGRLDGIMAQGGELDSGDGLVPQFVPGTGDEEFVLDPAVGVAQRAGAAELLTTVFVHHLAACRDDIRGDVLSVLHVFLALIHGAALGASGDDSDGDAALAAILQGVHTIVSTLFAQHFHSYAALIPAVVDFALCAVVPPGCYRAAELRTPGPAALKAWTAVADLLLSLHGCIPIYYVLYKFLLRMRTEILTLRKRAGPGAPGAGSRAGPEEEHILGLAAYFGEAVGLLAGSFDCHYASTGFCMLVVGDLFASLILFLKKAGGAAARTSTLFLGAARTLLALFVAYYAKVADFRQLTLQTLGSILRADGLAEIKGVLSLTIYDCVVFEGVLSSLAYLTSHDEAAAVHTLLGDDAKDGKDGKDARDGPRLAPLRKEDLPRLCIRFDDQEYVSRTDIYELEKCSLRSIRGFLHQICMEDEHVDLLLEQDGFYRIREATYGPSKTQHAKSPRDPDAEAEAEAGGDRDRDRDRGRGQGRGHAGGRDSGRNSDSDRNRDAGRDAGRGRTDSVTSRGSASHGPPRSLSSRVASKVVAPRGPTLPKGLISSGESDARRRSSSRSQASLVSASTGLGRPRASKSTPKNVAAQGDPASRIGAIHLTAASQSIPIVHPVYTAHPSINYFVSITPKVYDVETCQAVAGFLNELPLKLSRATDSRKRMDLSLYAMELLISLPDRQLSAGPIQRFYGAMLEAFKSETNVNVVDTHLIMLYEFARVATPAIQASIAQTWALHLTNMLGTTKRPVTRGILALVLNRMLDAEALFSATPIPRDSMLSALMKALAGASATYSFTNPTAAVIANIKEGTLRWLEGVFAILARKIDAEKLDETLVRRGHDSSDGGARCTREYDALDAIYKEVSDAALDVRFLDAAFLEEHDGVALTDYPALALVVRRASDIAASSTSVPLKASARCCIAALNTLQGKFGDAAPITLAGGVKGSQVSDASQTMRSVRSRSNASTHGSVPSTPMNRALSRTKRLSTGAVPAASAGSAASAAPALGTADRRLSDADRSSQGRPSLDRRSSTNADQSTTRSVRSIAKVSEIPESRSTEQRLKRPLRIRVDELSQQGNSPRYTPHLSPTRARPAAPKPGGDTPTSARKEAAKASPHTKAEPYNPLMLSLAGKHDDRFLYACSLVQTAFETFRAAALKDRNEAIRSFASRTTLVLPYTITSTRRADDGSRRFTRNPAYAANDLGSILFSVDSLTKEVLADSDSNTNTDAVAAAGPDASAPSKGSATLRHLREFGVYLSMVSIAKDFIGDGVPVPLSMLVAALSIFKRCVFVEAEDVFGDFGMMYLAMRLSTAASREESALLGAAAHLFTLLLTAGFNGFTVLAYILGSGHAPSLGATAMGMVTHCIKSLDTRRTPEYERLVISGLTPYMGLVIEYLKGQPFTEPSKEKDGNDAFSRPSGEPAERSILFGSPRTQSNATDPASPKSPTSPAALPLPSPPPSSERAKGSSACMHIAFFSALLACAQIPSLDLMMKIFDIAHADRAVLELWTRTIFCRVLVVPELTNISSEMDQMLASICDSIANNATELTRSRRIQDTNVDALFDAAMDESLGRSQAAIIGKAIASPRHPKMLQPQESVEYDDPELAALAASFADITKDNPVAAFIMKEVSGCGSETLLTDTLRQLLRRLDKIEIYTCQNTDAFAMESDKVLRIIRDIDSTMAACSKEENRESWAGVPGELKSALLTSICVRATHYCGAAMAPEDALGLLRSMAALYNRASASISDREMVLGVAVNTLTAMWIQMCSDGAEVSVSGSKAIAYLRRHFGADAPASSSKVENGDALRVTHRLLEELIWLDHGKPDCSESESTIILLSLLSKNYADVVAKNRVESLDPGMLLFVETRSGIIEDLLSFHTQDLCNAIVSRYESLCVSLSPRSSDKESSRRVLAATKEILNALTIMCKGHPALKIGVSSQSSTSYSFQSKQKECPPALRTIYPRRVCIQTALEILAALGDLAPSVVKQEPFLQSLMNL